MTNTIHEIMQCRLPEINLEIETIEEEIRQRLTRKEKLEKEKLAIIAYLESLNIIYDSKNNKDSQVPKNIYNEAIQPINIKHRTSKNWKQGAKNCILEYGGGATKEEILSYCDKNNIIIGGDNREMNFASMLSRNPEFHHNHNTGKWELTGNVKENGLF